MQSLRCRPLLVWTAALACLITQPARADVKAGVDDWQAKKYDAAVKEWRPLAEKGDPDAQFNMGQAYMLGTISKRLSALAGLQPHYENAGALTRLRAGPCQPGRSGPDLRGRKNGWAALLPRGALNCRGRFKRAGLTEFFPSPG